MSTCSRLLFPFDLLPWDYTALLASLKNCEIYRLFLLHLSSCQSGCLFCCSSQCLRLRGNIWLCPPSIHSVGEDRAHGQLYSSSTARLKKSSLCGCVCRVYERKKRVCVFPTSQLHRSDKPLPSRLLPLHEHFFLPVYLRFQYYCTVCEYNT